MTRALIADARADRSTLTPAQHQRIRLHLALLPVYMWLFYGWYVVIFLVPQPDPVRDFAHFYLLGRAAATRNAGALFDMDILAAIGQGLVPGIEAVRFPPAYPPQIALLFTPFAVLPYRMALYGWLLVTTVVYAICAFAIWRICPRLRHRRWPVAVLATAAPALHFTLGFSQISVLALVAVTLMLFALRADRRFVAGACVGLLAYKPTLGLAAAVVFTAAAEWQIVAGAATSALAQTAVGALYWGISPLAAYATALVRYASSAARLESNSFQMHSWRALFDLTGLPAPWAFAAFLTASIVTLVLATRCWRARGPLALRYAALLVATVLVDPHIYAYDLIVLTPALLLLWDFVAAERPGSAEPPRIVWLLYLCYAAPLFSALARWTGVQLSVIALAALGVWIARTLGSLKPLQAKPC